MNIFVDILSTCSLVVYLMTVHVSDLFHFPAGWTMANLFDVGTICCYVNSENKCVQLSMCIYMKTV